MKITRIKDHEPAVSDSCDSVAAQVIEVKERIPVPVIINSAKNGSNGVNGVTFTPSVDANFNLSWSNNGGLPNPRTVNIKDMDGKTAYQSAVSGGYTGTEAEFNAVLANALSKTVADLTYEPKITYPSNPTGKFYRDDKTFASIQPASGILTSELHLSNANSSVSGFKKLVYTPDPTETTVSLTTVNGVSPEQSYILDAMSVQTVVNAGSWSINYWRMVSSAANDTTITMRVFKRSPLGVITQLFSLTSPSIEDTAMTERGVSYSQPSFTIEAGYNLGISILANTTMPVPVTVSYIIGNGNGFNFTAPIQVTHSQLAAINGDPNYQHVSDVEKANVQKLISNGDGTKALYNDGTYKTPSGGGAAEDLLIGEYIWAVGQEVLVINADKLGAALSTRNLHAIDIIFNGVATACSGIKGCTLRINELNTNYVQDSSATDTFFTWYLNQVFSETIRLDVSDGNIHYNCSCRTSTTSNGSPITYMKYGYRLAAGATINHIRLSIPYTDGFPTTAFKVTIRKRG